MPKHGGLKRPTFVQYRRRKQVDVQAAKAELARGRAEHAANAGNREERRSAEQRRKENIVEQAAAKMREKLAAVLRHDIEPWRKEEISTEPWKDEARLRSDGDKRMVSRDSDTANMREAMAYMMKGEIGARVFQQACRILCSSNYPECPQGHALVTFKEGAHGLMSLIFTRACTNCGKALACNAPRWCCRQRCKFYLCHPCYKISVRQILREHRDRPTKVPLQAALSVAATAEMRDTEEFDSAAEALMELYCEDIRRAAVAHNPAQTKRAMECAMEALQAKDGVLPIKADFVSALNATLNETPAGLVEVLRQGVISRDWLFLRRLMVFESSVKYDFGLITTTSEVSMIAASAMIEAHPLMASWTRQNLPKAIVPWSLI